MLKEEKEPLAEARSKKLLPLEGAFNLAEGCRPMLKTVMGAAK
jgi:hypothetical protein